MARLGSGSCSISSPFLVVYAFLSSYQSVCRCAVFAVIINQVVGRESRRERSCTSSAQNEVCHVHASF